MDKQWWKEAVVYQIYPRSFKDSNGDGIGDLNGITEKLDYLKDLGIDAVWLSPCYESPNDDNGYDISNYRNIMKEFGTLDDWKRMIKEMHNRGIKLIMDLVVNHTSDEHQWFVEAKSSKNNPYRDYYVWRKGEKDQAPNDWVSYFSGSTWEYDNASGEYYLHLFSKKQPDLNWENEALRKEVYDMMTWWLEMGVDGFRMDVINMISKVEGLPSVANDGQLHFGGEYFLNGPKVHEYLQEMNREVLSKYDLMTVGETPGVSVEDAQRYSGADRKELSMVFQFELMGIDNVPGNKWEKKPYQLTEFKAVMSKWQYGLADKGWNSLYLNNHDQPRLISRFGNDSEAYRELSGKMLATMIHTLQGTPYVYQGEEIGMINTRFESLEDYKDIESLNMYKDQMQIFEEDCDLKKEDAAYQEAREKVHAEIMEKIYWRGRDNARTPIQWDSTVNGGFSDGEPWLLSNPNYKEINVEKAIKDSASIYHYYKKLIQLRKELPVIVYGRYEEILVDSEEIYGYTRTLDGSKLVVLLNFTDQEVRLEGEAAEEVRRNVLGLESLKGSESHDVMGHCDKSDDSNIDTDKDPQKNAKMKVVLSNYDQDITLFEIPKALRPYEALVLGVTLG